MESESNSQEPLILRYEHRFGGVPIGFLAACYAGILIGLADFMAHISGGLAIYRDLHFVLPPLVAATAAAMCGFFALWLVAAHPLSRITKVPIGAVTAGLCAAYCALGLWLELFIAYPHLLPKRPLYLACGLLGIAVILHIVFTRSLGNRWYKTPRAVFFVGVSYLLGGLCLLILRRAIALEDRWGFEAARQLETVTIYAGIAWSVGLIGIAGGRLAVREATRPPTKAWLEDTSYYIAEIWAIGAVVFWHEQNDLPVGRYWFLALILIYPVGLTIAGIVNAPKSRMQRWRVLANRAIPPLLAFVLLASPALFQPRATLDRVFDGRYQADGREIRKVLLITVDTLRADALGCYGGQAAETPAFDALAADSVLFENAFSTAPWTAPAVTSILTGLSPFVHQVIELESRLPEAAQPLAEYLQRQGYFTGATGDNPIMNRTRQLDQGFATYDFYPRPHPGRCYGSRLIQRFFPKFYAETATSGDLADRTVDWLGLHGDKDFFFWLHFFDPHRPYDPPERFHPPDAPKKYLVYEAAKDGFSEQERKWIRDLYAAEIEYVNESLVRVIAELKRQGIYEETLIVLTSDHGEEFWEHGGFGHGFSLYNGVIRVPLTVKLPGNLAESAAPARREEFVTTASIMPTLLDLLSIDYEPEFFSYPSIAKLLGPDEEPGPSPPLFSTALYRNYDEVTYKSYWRRDNAESFEDQEGVFYGQYKYSQEFTGELKRLFDLGEDPAERDTLIGARPEIVEEGQSWLAKHRSDSEDLRRILGLDEEASGELDPEMIEQLRDLGYLGN